MCSRRIPLAGGYLLPQLDASERVVGYYGVARDITERKQAKNRSTASSVGPPCARLTWSSPPASTCAPLGVVIDQVTAQLKVDAADVLLLDPHLQTLE